MAEDLPPPKGREVKGLPDGILGRKFDPITHGREPGVRPKAPDGSAKGADTTPPPAKTATHGPMPTREQKGRTIIRGGFEIG